MADRLVHIVDDVPELARPRDARRWCSSSTGSSTPATPRRSPPGTWSTCPAADAWSRPSTSTSSTTTAPAGPPMSFVRDHYEQYDAPRLVVRLLQRQPAARRTSCSHGPEPDNRWEAFARAVRAGRRALRREPGDRAWAPCRWRCRTPGRSRSPTTPTTPTLLAGDSPWRGELRIPSSAQALLELRLGEWGARRDGLRRPHPALPRPARLPAGVAGAARARRARGDGWPST